MVAEKWNELGRMHAGWAEWAAAQECFEAAITAEPARPALWANLALAAARTGDRPTADGALEMADTLQPERAVHWRRPPPPVREVCGTLDRLTGIDTLREMLWRASTPAVDVVVTAHS